MNIEHEHFILILFVLPIEWNEAYKIQIECLYFDSKKRRKKYKMIR